MSEIQEQQPVSSEPTAAPQVESTPAPQAQENMVPQSEVNRIVSTQKKEAYEKGLSAAQQAQVTQAQQQPAPQAHAGIDYNAAIQKEVESRFAQIEKAKQQQLLEESTQQQINSTIAALNPQFEAAENEIEGFDTQKIADVVKFDTLDGYNLAEMASKLPNSAHVLYELSKSPLKMVAIQRLRDTRPDLASIEMQKLSQSIINNQQGKNQASRTPEPLNQIKSSNVGGSGPATIADFKLLYKG